MLSFYGHIEELEWAAAEAASAGRLTMREAQDLLSFTDAHRSRDVTRALDR